MIISERFARETAREYALRAIRENITTLELEPGSRVSENELAAELGISRTPVREALIELSKIQIVEIYPQKGSYISLIDYDLVEEAQFMRLTLEKAIVELLCQQSLSEDSFKSMEENVKLEQFYVDNDNLSKLMELDNEFHRELFVLANKMQTYKLLNTMLIYFDRVRNLRIRSGSNQYIVDDHSEILNAIKAGDAQRGAQAMMTHLTRHKVDQEVLKKGHSAYFK